VWTGRKSTRQKKIHMMAWRNEQTHAQPLENAIYIFSPPSNIPNIFYLLDHGFLEFKLVFIHRLLAFTELEFKNAKKKCF